MPYSLNKYKYMYILILFLKPDEKDNIKNLQNVKPVTHLKAKISFTMLVDDIEIIGEDIPFELTRLLRYFISETHIILRVNFMLLDFCMPFVIYIFFNQNM